jgi:hypothetical protein
MQKLLAKLQLQYPALQFSAGSQFCWSPETKEIFYDTAAQGPKARWSLLHETAHALLGHHGYQADYELIRLEVDAWEHARELAGNYEIVIDEDHVQDCLDTYREWLYKRSICPSCATKCLQQDDYAHYRCFNCHTVWRVSGNRFGRSYRTTKNVLQAPTIFHLDTDL